MKKEMGIFVLLMALCAYVSFRNPQFLDAGNLQNNARIIGMYGIFSIGLGLIIITNGIDLSVGSVFALQGVVLSILLCEWGWHWGLSVFVTILGVMALGLFHGIAVTRFKMQPFIVTLCGLLVYRGLARYVADDGAKGFGSDGFELLRALALQNFLGIPIVFLLMLFIAAIAWVLLHRSVYGRYLYAVGRNEDAARYSGINTKLIVCSAYVISMFLSGIAGIIIAFYTNSVSPASHGNLYELYGIAAAVLGGCSLRGGEGSVLGIVIGTALLQVLRNLVILLQIPSSLEFAVMGVVIFLGVLADEIFARRRGAGVKA